MVFAYEADSALMGPTQAASPVLVAHNGPRRSGITSIGATRWGL
jgi:hypothetical protein